MADISKITVPNSSGTNVTYDFKDTQARTDVANSFKEAFLTWGGKNLTGTYAPIDSAMNPVLSANRLAGFKPAGTTIEYSTDNGSTWNTYTTTDGGKTALFTTQATYYLGGPSAKAGSTTANNKLRITIDGIDGQVYTQLNKIHMYVSTNGSAGSTVTVESSPYSNPTVFSTVASNVPLSGWSGWNVINFTLPGTGAFGGSNSSTHQRKIRFTFSNTGCTSTYSGLQIMKIYGYGGVGWTTPSTIAANGVPYTYDYAGNVTIPASLTVSGTINGTVTNATKATQDSLGQTITSTYIKNITASGTTVTFTKGDGTTTGTFTTQDTKNTAGSTNTTSTIYLVGATSQAANPQTYSNSKVYMTNGILNLTSLVGTGTISIGRLSGSSEGTNSNTIGYNVTASGSYSYAEGYKTQAGHSYSHAEGYCTKAYKSTESYCGSVQHVEGMNNVVKDAYSYGSSAYVNYVSGTTTYTATVNDWRGSVYVMHTGGGPAMEDAIKLTLTTDYTLSSDNKTLYLTSTGVSKIPTSWTGVTLNAITEYPTDKFLHIVGNGYTNNNRSNAYALDFLGNGRYNKDVYINCNADSTGGNKVIAENLNTSDRTLVPTTAGTYEYVYKCKVTVNSSGTVTGTQYGWYPVVES